MEKDAEVVVAALGSCRQRRAELEKEVNGLEREANETEAKLKRFTLEVTAMTDKGEALAKQVHWDVELPRHVLVCCRIPVCSQMLLLLSF